MQSPPPIAVGTPMPQPPPLRSAFRRPPTAHWGSLKADPTCRHLRSCTCFFLHDTRSKGKPQRRCGCWKLTRSRAAHSRKEVGSYWHRAAHRTQSILLHWRRKRVYSFILLALLLSQVISSPKRLLPWLVRFQVPRLLGHSAVVSLYIGFFWRCYHY